MLNIFKVNSKDTETTYFILFLTVSILDFGQVSIC